MNDIDIGNIFAIVNAIERNLSHITITGDCKLDKKLLQEFHVDVVKEYLDEIREIVSKANR